MSEVKQKVREFYDQVGWKLVSDDIYQNARYEDLRPVSREYIHRCHLRVQRHLPQSGRFLLDAGSGPIQYPEYLLYSQNHQFRVCADISVTALLEARRRIADHGLFVVCDIAHLPFKSETFEGIVSLHTIHHVPDNEKVQAYDELYRVLSPNNSAVVVNGWSSSRLMDFFDPLVRFANRLRSASGRLTGRRSANKKGKDTADNDIRAEEKKPKGTFSLHSDVDWFSQAVGTRIPTQILVWRSVSVRFLRALIQPWLGGRYWLRLLYWLEERNPQYFGENGVYPLIVIRKS